MRSLLRFRGVRWQTTVQGRGPVGDQGIMQLIKSNRGRVSLWGCKDREPKMAAVFRSQYDEIWVRWKEQVCRAGK